MTTVRLGLTGDVMLGRLVDQDLADPRTVPAEIWGDLLPVFAAVDVRLINLECVIATTGQPDPERVFHFRARPRALEVLRAAHVDFVGLANNHVLDYGQDAFVECLSLLSAHGIVASGAGRTIDEAAAPTFVRVGARTLAVVAFTDNDPEWAAGPARPGVSYVAYGPDGLHPAYRDRLAASLVAARAHADVVAACAHVGPNWGTPSRAMRALAHQTIALGADVYWGHSNHAVQAIEFYRQGVILYSTGDFLDDYIVDPDERNDLSLFFAVALQPGRAPEVRMYPVQIRDRRVRRASGRDADWLCARLRDLSAPYGTAVSLEDTVLNAVPAQAAEGEAGGRSCET